jgi:hypothetical protein
MNVRRNPIRTGLPIPPGGLNPQADGREVPIGLGPAAFNPSQPRGAGPNRRIILPGCDFPPADAIPVDETGDGDPAAGATSTLITIQVPDFFTLRLAGIGFGADDESNLRFLSWSIKANPPGSAVTGYSNRAGSIGSIQQLASIFVVLGSSVTVMVDVVNGGNITSHFVARLQGWFYSEREAA